MNHSKNTVKDNILRRAVYQQGLSVAHKLLGPIVILSCTILYISVVLFSVTFRLFVVAFWHIARPRTIINRQLLIFKAAPVEMSLAAVLTSHLQKSIDITYRFLHKSADGSVIKFVGLYAWVSPLNVRNHETSAIIFLFKFLKGIMNT